MGTETETEVAVNQGGLSRVKVVCPLLLPMQTSPLNNNSKNTSVMGISKTERNPFARGATT